MITFRPLFMSLMVATSGPSKSFVYDQGVDLPSAYFIPAEVVHGAKKYKFVAVGEIHGTNEAPNFVGALAASVSDKETPLKVGLEIPASENKNIKDFLNSGDPKYLRQSAFFGRRTFGESHQDGRSSEAMARLLESLRHLTNVSVFLFDVPPDFKGDGQARDTQMAKNILKEINQNLKARFLILAGNIHTRLNVGYPEHPDYRPMLFQVHSSGGSPLKKSEILSIHIRSAVVAAWGDIGDKVDTTHLFFSDPDSFSTSSWYVNYFLFHDEFDGYNASVFFDHMTSSVPFLPSVMEHPRMERFISEYDGLLTADYSALVRQNLDLTNRDSLKKRLEQMVKVDQRARYSWNFFADQNFNDAEKGIFSSKQKAETRIIDEKNLETLKIILKKIEWPKISEYGEKIDSDTWLLVQHMDFDLAFQKAVLQTLSKLYPARETKPSNYAYLYDRVATNENRPQRYGTQGKCTGEGEWKPNPLEDEANVDKLRSSVGLETLKAYTAKFQFKCHKFD